MADRLSADDLDILVEALLHGGAAPKSPADAELLALAAIALDLRDSPSAKFKDRLRKDLLGRATTMTSATVSSPVRAGFHTVTPYIIAERAAEMIEFVKQVFGAEEKFRGTGSGGGIHCELRLGDSMLMMGGGGSYKGPSAPAALHHYVVDADKIYSRAIEHGALSAQPMTEDYGERFGSVTDPFGNKWYIARSLTGNYVPAGLRDVNLYFHPIGTPKFIEFIERAFGAEKVARYDSPEGKVLHAKYKIGDSVIEMGEAHGPWQPLATHTYLYVPNTDLTYRRALEAGATSLSEPVDHPYGDRGAGVLDPFGHTWYIATHLGQNG
jgi:uncharacterized glyoxalase superfamily protein PhnB